VIDVSRRHKPINLPEKGLSLDTAAQKAGEIRFVPVLLTTMTAIGGLLPIALSGSALYSPLAWATPVG
jgi:multidrug efflux pump subunit AcrB